MPHELSFKRTSVALIKSKYTNQVDLTNLRFDTYDEKISFHAQIIGKSLSSDHRSLYVNCRAWPENCKVGKTFFPPPVAQEIDIHVIDLATFTKVGRVLMGHKAYSSFTNPFIFLDVCHEFVAR